jgi:hypothetical protein
VGHEGLLPCLHSVSTALHCPFVTPPSGACGLVVRLSVQTPTPAGPAVVSAFGGDDAEASIFSGNHHVRAGGGGYGSCSFGLLNPAQQWSLCLRHPHCSHPPHACPFAGCDREPLRRDGSVLHGRSTCAGGVRVFRGGGGGGGSCRSGWRAIPHPRSPCLPLSLPTSCV